MSPIIAGIATFFSVGAFIFYAVAASGYSQDSTLKGSNWFYLDGTNSYNYKYIIYFGLKGLLVSIPDVDVSINMTLTVMNLMMISSIIQWINVIAQVKLQ